MVREKKRAVGAEHGDRTGQRGLQHTVRKRKGLLVQNTVTGQDRTEGSAAHCEEKKRAVGAEHGDRTGQDRGVCSTL